MFFLILAILGSGVIPVIFRAFEVWRVNLYWAIPINYLAAVTIGAWLSHDSVPVEQLAAQPWVALAALQGLLLAVNFYLLAHTAQRAGVAIAALASRISVAIPALLAFFLYGDSLSPTKLVGLVAALAALYLCTAPEKGSGVGSRLFQLLPLLVFATFGCYFTILKYLQTHHLHTATYHAYVMAGFTFAFLTACAIGAGRGLLTLKKFRRLDLLAGLGLGCVNYLAVYALLRVLALQGWQSRRFIRSIASAWWR